MSIIRNLIACGAALTLTTLASAAPQATPTKVKLAKAAPNCEISGKKSHAKDKAACEKKKGKWLEDSATTAPAKDAAAPAAPAAPAVPAPAPEEKK